MYAHHDLLEERTSLLARLGVKGSGDDSHFEAKARASIFFASVPEEPTENLDLLTSKLQARPKCAVLDSSSDSAPDTSGELQPELFVVKEKQKHKIVKGQIDDWEPQLETELYMQKKDRRWKKKWIGYANTTLRKQEIKHQKSGFYKTSQVVYCDQRRSRRCILDPFLPNDKIIYIQTDRDKYMFQVYTHDKVHNFKCATKKECVRWYSTIREDLMRFYTAHEWAEKQELAKDLNRVLRAQFNFELLRYTQLLFRIANAGLFETHFFDEQGSATMAGVMEILIEKKRLKGIDEGAPGDADPSLLQPTMKDAPPPLLGASVDLVAGSTMESGILGSSGEEEIEEGEKEDEQKVWKEFYFVMADAVLLLFKSSKAKEPSSVLALKYATVYVDEAALRSGQYIWCISSPMGRFYFRAKHDVVLSEWLFAADKEIRGRKRINKSTSSSILEKLYRIQTDVSTMRHVIESAEGRKTLNKYLRDARDEEGQNELQIWKAIARVHSHTSTPEDRKRGRPVLAKLLRDPVRIQKLLTPPTPPPLERKHQHSKSSKSEKETKELFENPRDSFTDQDSDVDEKDEENEPKPTILTKIDDVVGWRYVSHLLVQRLHNKHFLTFAKTADYDALKKYLAHRWTPKRDSGSERTSRRPSRHNSIQKNHSDLALGTSPTQGSVLSSTTSGLTSGISGELGVKLGKPTTESREMSGGMDGKEKEKERDTKEKDTKEKEPPDKTGLIEDDKDLEPFDPSTVQLSIEYLRKSGRDKETVVKKIIKLPKNRDHIGIGRASSNSVRLPDPGVSRTHGRIEWKTKTLIYIDLGSAYGTKLNGESIKRAVLQIGDVLKMGKNSSISVQSRVKSKSKLSMCRVM